MKRILHLLITLVLLLALLSTAGLAEEQSSSNVFVLPSGLLEVEAEAFADNVMLGTVIVPNTVTAIGSKAFDGCTNLTEVTIASREIEIADDAFSGCSVDMVFYAHNGSTAMTWALAHGYVCESLDDGSEYLERFAKLISYSGFSRSMLMSESFASKCLIIRTENGRLPDISAYHPIDIFKSDANLYFVQFADVGSTEDCWTELYLAGYQVEEDKLYESDSMSAEGVTISDNWLSDDVMGFDVYAPYVAQHKAGSLTIAVIDSGVLSSAWAGPVSDNAISYAGGDVLSDPNRHGSKVASIISDSLGENVSNVTLLPIKVETNNAQYRTTMVIQGLKHAIESGADIINMSLGWRGEYNAEIQTQINEARKRGILVVVAAGNGSGPVMFPANCNGTIAVSALTYSEQNGYSVLSCTGNEITYTAPGHYLKSTAYPRIDLKGDVLDKTASSSFAAPQITAALALIKLDSTKSGSATATLDSCCDTLSAAGLTRSAVGHGLPELDRLARIPVTEVILSNENGGAIPQRLWLGSADDHFTLTWDIMPSNATDKTVTVTSSDSSVVSAVQNGSTDALISAVGVGTATVTVTCGSVTKQLDLVVEQPVTQISIAGFNGDAMIIGDSVQLAAVILPETATNKTVTWSSSNTAVAEVSGSGVVTALTEGNATITCAAVDGYGTYTVLEISVIDIPPAESISLFVGDDEVTNAEIIMEKGDTLALSARVSPARAEQDVYYAAYPANVVGVSANGIIMANAAGTASVVATASTGRNVTSYVTVKVIIIPTDIDVSAANTVLDIGGITSVSALLTPSDVTETAVTWESTDTSVLTVNASGIVTAVAPGSAAIRGTTVNGKTDSVTFTVRRPITITLDADGGTCSQIEISAFSGYAIGGLPTATRQYYNFKGWYTANGITVTADTAFDDDTTLYARWEGLPFILTLDANGGAFGPEYNNATEIDREAKVGTKVGALPLPSRDNYSFLGWYTAQTQENGVEVTADYIQQTTTGLTVYAIWISHPYPMYFDANDGTCDILSKTGAVDKPIGELPVPERPYYTFDGWFTSDGTEVTPFYTQSDATPVTVYAHWTPEQYTMTFDVNGGSCAVTQNSYPVDMDIGELPVPTRDYYIFTGWYIEGDPVIHVTASYQQATTDDVTATARWTPLPYSVTFNANGGSCTECTRTVYVDTAIGDLPVPELPYHHFDGWYTSAAGGTEVNSRYTQSTTDELVLYAHWTPGQYTITFYRVFKDSFQVVYTRLVQVGHEVGTLPTVEEPAGYSFLGWFTSPNGGTELLPNYRQLNDSSFNVYTRWSPKPYKMSFNANGGSCSTSSMIGYVDTAIGELPVPTREYYSFLGWYTASTGGVEVTEDYARLTNTNVTVYAHWEPMPYTMMFNANGANASTPVSAINTFRVDTPIGEGQLPEPTRPYYTFDGWYTEPGEDDGVKVTPTYAHPNTSAITVYAHWIPYTYRLLLDANGGDCNPYSIMASVDTEVELPEPYRDCYLFEGWYSDDNTKYTDEYIQATADSVTLHAHWIAYADSITVPSGTINEDTPFFCRGRILVRGVIECVTGGVYQNGVCVTNGGMEFSYTPSDPTMQIWLDDTPFYTSLDLYSLEPGDYTFRIVAHCANGLEQVIADNPIAIVEYTGATSFKFNKIKYYENQKANTGWNTGGTISSDVNLTKVTGIIKKSNGSTIGSLVSITPNATSYDLNSSAFNNKMLFDSCGNGNYVYIVTATDASGRKMELNMYYTASNAEFSAATRVTQTFNMPTLVGQRVTSDRIYLYYASNMHWDNARTFAQNMGGDLTCITSAEENSVVFGGMPSGYSDKYFLIGGYKSGSNWVWCTGESMSYTNWCSGEPSNSYGIETYLSLHVNEGWNDISCGSGNLVGFIVEIPRS